MRDLLTCLAVSVGLISLTPGCIMGELALVCRETVDENRRFDAGGTFRLENVNGTVTVDTWGQNRVRIQAEKAAHNKSALSAIEIDIDGEGDWVEVKTHLPRSGLFFGSGGKVTYHITLPERARAQVETVNGRIEITGIEGQVRASTVNGSVDVGDVQGEVEISTVNGGIKAAYRRVAAEGRHRSKTTNGSVTLHLPWNASGEFEARTVNGSIQTDFPLDVIGKFGNRRLRGRLGGARSFFDVSTVNGSVRILESASYTEKSS